MINAKDLRIGNILQNRCKLVSVLGVTIMDRVYYGSVESPCYNYIIDFKPIPLTPEILEQIGFDKITDSDNDDLFDFETSFGFKLTLFKLIGVDYYRVMDVDNSIDIKYLHELQNTFYIFNNKQELPININTLKI